MIKAIIFDIGGVLSRMTRATGSRLWEQRLGLAENTLGHTIYQSSTAQRAFVGQASDSDVWEAMRARFNLTPAELAELQRDFWGDWEWDAALLDFIRALRPRYRTGVISDAMPGARREVEAYVNSSLFDVILFSGEIGLLKPAAELFDRALAALSAQRGEAVFIDDNARIVAGAQALGIHAIRFTSREQALAELAQVLASEG